MIEYERRPAVIRWMKLLDREIVERLVAHRKAERAEAVYLNIGPVELKVTDHEARYFVPPYLSQEFEDLQVNFCVRP